MKPDHPVESFEYGRHAPQAQASLWAKVSCLAKEQWREGVRLHSSLVPESGC